MGTVRFTLESDQAKLVSGMLRLAESQKKSAEGFERQVKGAREFDRVGTRLAQTIAGAGGVGSIAGAVAILNRHYETWIANVREIANESKRAADEATAFAALQAGGTRAERVHEVARVGAVGGVGRGEAFNAVQALQSAMAARQPTLTEEEAYRRGLTAFQTVIAARNVGVPVAAGLEAETLGTAFGDQPGQMARRLVAAGRASARDPRLLATVAPAFEFFRNRDFGAAAAGQLAGTFGAQTEVYTRQAGIALSRTGALQKVFQRVGLGDASEMERLQYLADQGLTTPEALKGVGVGEIRRQAAVSNLARNVAGVRRMLGEIEAVQPGYLVSMRAGMEREDPMLRYERESRILTQMYRNELVYGEQAPAAREAGRDEQIRGLALRRLGLTRGLWGGRMITEEGRAPIDTEIVGERLQRPRIRPPMMGFDILQGTKQIIEADQVPGVRDVMEEIRNELREINEKTVTPRDINGLNTSNRAAAVNAHTE